ncbi:MAG: hypothetical protein KBC30_11570 [Planctomycetes bacterium]|nr:hypothetical protein [Planctomycetota bacterium]
MKKNTFISCLANKWTGIYVQGTDVKKPATRCLHSMFTYNGEHYIACGYSNNNECLSDIWRMDITNSSQIFTQIHAPNSHDAFQGSYGSATLILNNKLYVIMGATPDNNVSEGCLYSYDFTSNEKTWIKEYDANENFQSRIYFAVAAISNLNRIYVFGGVKPDIDSIDQERSNLIEGDQIFGYFSYSSENETWNFQTIPLGENGPSARYGHSMIAMDNTLYLFGGTDDEIMFNTIWKYDVNKNNWQEIDTEQSEIPEGRYLHTMLPHLNKEFWILGGSSGGATRGVCGKTFNDIWKFDTVENKWTKKGEAPISFCATGSVLQEGEDMKIYIWGGSKDGSEYLPQDIIYEYTHCRK